MTCIPRTVRCNDLLSGDAARQPADLDPQVLAGLTAQGRQQTTALVQTLGLIRSRSPKR